MSDHRKYIGAALLTALMLWLSWPMQNFTAFIFFAFVPLLLVEHDLNEKKEIRASRYLFRYSFIAFFLWNTASTYWIWNASGVGMVIAILLNSFLMSFGVLVYHLVKRTIGFKWALPAFISIWISIEFFHNTWDLSWPWLTLGNAFATQIKWIQWYEYTGIFGGSFWVLAVNALLFSAIIRSSLLNTKKLLPNLKIYSIPFLLIIAPILLSNAMFNSYKEEKNGCHVVVVQPNIDPYHDKFNGMSEEDQLNRLIQLSEVAGKTNTEFFIWPETALQNNLQEENLDYNPLIVNARKFLSKYRNGNIISGADTYKTYQTKETATARKFRNGQCCYDAFNAAVLIENDPGVQVYHKSKLVPGVERMPYPKFFSFLEPLALNMGGTFGSLGMQDDRTVFYSQSGIGVAPVICYESIYGEFISEYIKNGAQMIAIVTNDGWWGNTPGYKQHNAYASLRAIETRRSIARSANTGISSFINQRGEIIDQTEWWVPDALSAEINLNTDITFYVKNGDWIARISSFCAFLLLLFTLIKKRISR